MRLRALCLISLYASVACASPQARPSRRLVAGNKCALFGEQRTMHCWGWSAKVYAGVEPGGKVAVPLPLEGLEETWPAGDPCGRTKAGESMCMRSLMDYGVERRIVEVDGWPEAPVKSVGHYVLLADGTVLDEVGQSYTHEYPRLPDGTFDEDADIMKVRIEQRFEQLADGLYHTCGLDEEGQVYCWGDNGHGALGVGKRELENCLRFSPDYERPFLYCTDVPQRVALEGEAVEISAGGHSSCAVLENGHVQCWGQMLTPRGSLVQAPRRVRQLDDVASAGVSSRFGCALRFDGSVWCWGKNEEGMLGDGTANDREHAAPVRGLPPASELAVGEVEVCVVARDLALWCWGDGVGSNRPIRVHAPGTISPP